MTYLAASENVVLECPDYVKGLCKRAGCPRFLTRVSKDRIDDFGNQLYRGACMLNGDVEWFSGCPPYKNEYSQVQTAAERSNEALTERRYKGQSVFDGVRVHQDIESDSQKQFIKVNNRRFRLTRTLDWVIVDRMLKAVRDRECGCVIELSSKEYNALSENGKSLVKYCLEREPATQRDRAQKYTGKARIKPNLLRANTL